MTSTPETTTPSCYRHPGRETWVRCSRCDRSICPDCMHDAAVGFQCPECVAAGHKSVRSARTVFGGRVTSNPRQITMALLAINVVVFILQLASNDEVTRRFELFGWAIALQDEYYRLLTAAFLHGSVLHIAFNMYALFLVGPALEAAFGRVRFVGLYLFAALGGSAASYYFNNPSQPSVGASGAIFGLFAAYFVVARRLNSDSGGIAAVIGINLVLQFVIPNIDWRAHLGGLVTGAALAAVLVYAPNNNRRTAFTIAGFAAAAMLIAAAVILRTQDLRALAGV